MAPRDRPSDLGPRRVEEPDETEQAEAALGLFALVRRLRAIGQAPTRDRENAQSQRRVALENIEYLVAVGIGERKMVGRASDHRRPRQHLLGRALDMDREAAVCSLVHGRHEAQGRVEAKEPPPLMLATGDVDVDAQLPGRLEQSDLGRLAA